METYTLKVKYKDCWIKYTDYYLIDSIEKYQEYLDILSNKFSVSECEIKSLNSFVGHAHTDLTSIVGFLSGGMKEKKEDRIHMLIQLKKLYGEVMSNQIKSLLDDQILLINSKGGYFSINKNDEYIILDTNNKKYTKNDIKISKWFGGTHFYAKISEVDVIDESGNVKWFTEEDANNAAEKYLIKLNERYLK